MKVLITGATGLVGHHMVINFLNLGFQVVAIGRSQSRLQELRDRGASTIEFDLTAPVEKFMLLVDEDADIWIHCAAAVPGADEALLNEVNVKGTGKLLQVAAETDIRFFHISSITVYGIGDGNFREDGRLSPKSRYAISKIKAEKLVINSKLRWTVLRPPFIGGPKDTNFLEEIATRVRKRSIPLTKGMIAIIDARDIASIVSDIVEKEETVHQIYNIQGHKLEFRDFVNMMGQSLELTPPYGRKYPYWLQITIGTIADIYAKIRRISNERGISRYRIKSLNSNRTMNTDKIDAIIDFQPQFTLQETISDWLYNLSE